jgi:3-deoxy-D-manno-octulosonic-acid transferase
LGLFIYNIFLFVYGAFIRLASLFNKKAKSWVEGRKNLFERLDATLTTQAGSKEKGVIWMHCASLGEFEQGRPVLEKLNAVYPDHKLLLTFFSPSGYEVRKQYAGVDAVFYLPLDGKKNARRFLKTVKPSMVIFVKYEFWYFYLREINKERIPLLLISALFRKESVFFRWYGTLQRRMLTFFSRIFVQDEESKNLLQSLGLDLQVVVSGDTRFDRVIEIASKSPALPALDSFIRDNNVIVAGSTWPEDEQLLKTALSTDPRLPVKLIVAPHEVTTDHIAMLQKQFTGSVLYSELSRVRSDYPDADVLIIDNIGMLSKLYRYASICYIGGGFGKGIHNTLEAAVYGRPLLFGPNHQKFNEALQLIKMGAAVSISNTAECRLQVEKWLKDKKAYAAACNGSRDYVFAGKGASEKIVTYIQENRLLTS